jgi:quaternary ammonium compound-resistance protein SugE
MTASADDRAASHEPGTAPDTCIEMTNLMLPWIYLVFAGLLEVGWAAGLKYTEGWTRLWPSVGTLGLMIASFYFLSLAVCTLPAGTAYAMWTGIGAVGMAVVGMVLFDEPRNALRVMCLALIVAGIVGLKVTAEAR